ncbi:unnamed protein product, partial [Phaeothamnion confervicola]
MDRGRVQAYLQAACAALNFDIGEIWCCNDTVNGEARWTSVLTSRGEKEALCTSWARRGQNELHFIQLYTSPAYCDYRTKLVTPSDDWENHKDVNRHRFSPLICEAVRDGGQIVWANTTVEEGLLGRSDLPLRTAVGAPVCNVGFDLCILVMFSPCILPNTPEAMEFLYTMAQAASDAMCGFLPASASSPVHHVLQMPGMGGAANGGGMAGGGQFGDHHRSRAIIDALPKTISFQTWALQQIPLFAGWLRRGSSPELGGLVAGGLGGKSFGSMSRLGSLMDLCGGNGGGVGGIGGGGIDGGDGGEDGAGSGGATGFSPMSAPMNDWGTLDEMGFELDDDFLIWSSVMDGSVVAAAAAAAAAAGGGSVCPSPIASGGGFGGGSSSGGRSSSGGARSSGGDSSSSGINSSGGDSGAAAVAALPAGAQPTGLAALEAVAAAMAPSSDAAPAVAVKREEVKASTVASTATVEAKPSAAKAASLTAADVPGDADAGAGAGKAGAAAGAAVAAAPGTPAAAQG